MSKSKRNALLLLLAVGLLILILAMGLPTLVLSAGVPFALGQFQPDLGASGLFPGGDQLLLLFRGFLAVALVLLPVYILYSLLTAEGRRRLIVNLVLIVLLFMIADYLQNHPLEPSEQQQQQEQGLLGPQELEGQSGLTPPVFPANPPSWLTLAVIVIGSILIVIVVFAVVWFFRQRTQPPPSALEQLAKTAQNTIDSLHTGEDFEVVIIRCYQQMNRVVKETNGIARETAMTAREFEDRLINKGLPKEAIQTLTRLFEQVRYGHMSTGTREENLAVSCLTDIVNACGGRYEAR